jgi:hypothetical protein
MKPQTIAEQAIESDHPTVLAEAWASSSCEMKIGTTLIDRWNFIDDSYLETYYWSDGRVTHETKSLFLTD